MNQGRSATYVYRIMNLICISFLIYLIFTPTIYSHTEGNLFDSGSSSNGLMRIPTKRTTISFINTALTESELLSDIEINHVINNSFKMIRQLPNTGFYALVLPLIGACVFVYYMKCYIRKTDQQISILASSMGGHAPPIYA